MFFSSPGIFRKASYLCSDIVIWANIWEKRWQWGIPRTVNPSTHNRRKVKGSSQISSYPLKRPPLVQVSNWSASFSNLIICCMYLIIDFLLFANFNWMDWEFCHTSILDLVLSSQVLLCSDMISISSWEICV
jgi:hypothetical protein